MTIWYVDDITELMPSTMQRLIADAHYNKFLKDQREMPYRDWLIERKLTEAGGFGRRVYIHLARGQSKTLTMLKHAEELEAKGKEVYFVDYRDSAKKTTPNNIEKVRGCIVDWDLISNRSRWETNPSFLDMRLDFETKKANPQPLQLYTYEQLNRDLFQRQYLGRWHFEEEEDDRNQNGKHDVTDYNGR